LPLGGEFGISLQDSPLLPIGPKSGIGFQPFNHHA